LAGRTGGCVGIPVRVVSRATLCQYQYSMRLVRPFVTVLRRAGYRIYGLDEFIEAADPDARFSADVVHNALCAAVALSGDPDLGLHAAETFEKGDIDLLEYVASCGATARDSLAAVNRYLKLVNDAMTCRLELEGDLAIWRFVEHIEVPRASVDFAVASGFFAAARCFPGERLVEIRFGHAQPDDDSEYQRVFRGTPIRFGQAVSGLVFDQALLDCPPATADPRLHEVLQRQAEAALERLPRVGSLAERVRDLVRQELAGGNPTADFIAAKLCMSRRNLTRRLAAENTCHKQIVDELRRELASRYLRMPELGVAEVAFMLGFSHASAFHKAFKRWMGITPAQFRSQPAPG
jgi:AraC-like DNA-binding protein